MNQYQYMHRNLVTLTHPLGRTRRVLGPVGAQVERRKCVDLRDFALDKCAALESLTLLSAMQERCLTRAWNMAVKYDEWVQIIDAYLAGDA